LFLSANQECPLALLWPIMAVVWIDFANCEYLPLAFSVLGTRGGAFSRSVHVGEPHRVALSHRVQIVEKWENGRLGN
jgi:hypothetical protein